MLVTAGATEALAATILGLADDGDEVVTLEPFYDAYGALIALSRAEHRTVPLRLPDFLPPTTMICAAPSPIAPGSSSSTTRTIPRARYSPATHSS